MKPRGSSKKFRASQAEAEAATARAPGKDRPLTAREEAKWSTGVLVNGGGYKAVRKALAAKRKPGQRGPQVAPTKQLVSVRYSPEVLEFFKAGGPGWQSRMDEALKQWVSSRSKTKRRIPSEA
ncbi:MAG: BrnA antitoxin family protein [Burkholderiales bacterium]